MASDHVNAVYKEVVTHPPLLPQPPSPRADADTISIIISSIEVKSGSSLAEDPTIVQLFVEYQFLNFNYGDLETISVPKPPLGQSAMLDFKTGD